MTSFSAALPSGRTVFKQPFFKFCAAGQTEEHLLHHQHKWPFFDEASINATIDSGLDSMIVSIDGVTQESYERYRINGKLDKVLQGVKNSWRLNAKERLSIL